MSEPVSEGLMSDPADTLAVKLSEAEGRLAHLQKRETQAALAKAVEVLEDFMYGLEAHLIRGLLLEEP